MKLLTGAGVLVAATVALSACGGSHRVVTITDRAPGPVHTTLPAPLLKLIHSLSKDSSVTARRVEVYGPASRRALVEASSGDLVQKIAAERKGFYLIVLHGHFVAGSHPQGAKPPHGTVETQVWSGTEGVTDTGISNSLPAAVYRLNGPTLVAFGGSARGPSRGRISSTTVSSSRLILDGRVRCTATVSRSVEVGSPLGITFALRNVSKHPAKVFLGRGGQWVVVRAANGATYDTRVPLRNEIGPMALPTTLPPGATETVAYVGKYLPVRWSGPLRVRPGCGTTALPALTVAVKAPGPPPDERTAVADVVAASGHLLDHCRPKRPGIAVRGQIYPPRGRKIYPPRGTTPPMAATCSVSLRRERQFLVAQVLIASPPGIDHVHVNQPYEQLSVHHASPYEVVGWQFVVTKNGATPVAATEVDATKAANRMAPDWSWTSSGVQRLGSGDSRCGGSGESWGGAGPTVEFITTCPS
jgi:hypothetical protein